MQDEGVVTQWGNEGWGSCLASKATPVQDPTSMPLHIHAKVSRVSLSPPPNLLCTPTTSPTPHAPPPPAAAGLGNAAQLATTRTSLAHWQRLGTPAHLATEWPGPTSRRRRRAGPLTKPARVQPAGAKRPGPSPQGQWPRRWGWQWQLPPQPSAVCDSD